MNIYIFLLLFLSLNSNISYVHDDSTEDNLPHPTQDIFILYENDVHCAVDAYAKFAALRNEKRDESPFVTTVSSGDFLQGESIGSITKGQSIINIMNAVGYDYVVPGNHEFDYGINNLAERTKELSATVVDCNFCSTADGQPVYRPYMIKRYDNVNIAYIGVSTPATITSSTPVNFIDDKGKYIYDFHGQDLARHVQLCVDKARSEGAHYVIALTHLGIDESEVFTSPMLVSATTGIDVLLDAHSHSVLPDTTFFNKEGKPVLVTSTGTKFHYLGLLTLDTQGKFHSRLVKTDNYPETDEKTLQAIIREKEKIEALTKREIGYTDFDVISMGKNGERLSRCRETPIGDLLTDILRLHTGADLSILNGGAFRSNIKSGKFTYADVDDVSPFDNTLVTATITGRQLLDAIEVGMYQFPNYNGSFTQVSGIMFDVDSSVTTNIRWDDKGLFLSIPEDSPHRVKNLLILDRDTGRYSPVKPDCTYTIASSDYLLINKGSKAMLDGCRDVHDTGLDFIDVICDYIINVFKGTIPAEYARTDGRINIIQK